MLTVDIVSLRRCCCLWTYQFFWYR